MGGLYLEGPIHWGAYFRNFMRIEAQCRNFKFWLTLTKNENKLSQIAYNDIKWNENKALRSKKIKSLLEQIGLGELWMKAHYADIGIVNMIRQ